MLKNVNAFWKREAGKLEAEILKTKNILDFHK